MPGSAPAMQLVPVKIFLHRHNPIAVKHPPYPSFGFGVHALSGMWFDNSIPKMICLIIMCLNESGHVLRFAIARQRAIKRLHVECFAILE
jgi:hypothetical protein